ncbi:hypothetical protein BC835DRAFT_1075410 [Cytidiella melzeri]|nr:hypothetical protein BC835DRAFT_1075410 [Cytidiella melzeri]
MHRDEAACKGLEADSPLHGPSKRKRCLPARCLRSFDSQITCEILTGKCINLTLSYSPPRQRQRCCMTTETFVPVSADNTTLQGIYVTYHWAPVTGILLEPTMTMSLTPSSVRQGEDCLVSILSRDPGPGRRKLAVISRFLPRYVGPSCEDNPCSLMACFELRQWPELLTIGNEMSVSAGSKCLRNGLPVRNPYIDTTHSR